MKRLSQVIAILLSLLMVASALFACTPKKEEEVKKTAGEKTDWVTWQTVASEMETFVFQYTQNAKEIDVLSNCFDGLTTNDEYGALVPCIAESWETPDGASVALFLCQFIERDHFFVEVVRDIGKSTAWPRLCAQGQQFHQGELDTVQAKIVEPCQCEKKQANDSISVAHWEKACCINKSIPEQHEGQGSKKIRQGLVDGWADHMLFEMLFQPLFHG